MLRAVVRGFGRGTLRRWRAGRAAGADALGCPPAVVVGEPRLRLRRRRASPGNGRQREGVDSGRGGPGEGARRPAAEEGAMGGDAAAGRGRARAAAARAAAVASRAARRPCDAPARELTSVSDSVPWRWTQTLALCSVWWLVGCSEAPSPAAGADSHRRHVDQRAVLQGEEDEPDATTADGQGVHDVRVERPAPASTDRVLEPVEGESGSRERGRPAHGSIAEFEAYRSEIATTVAGIRVDGDFGDWPVDMFMRNTRDGDARHAGLTGLAIAYTGSSVLLAVEFSPPHLTDLDLLQVSLLFEGDPTPVATVHLGRDGTVRPAPADPSRDTMARRTPPTLGVSVTPGPRGLEGRLELAGLLESDSARSFGNRDAEVRPPAWVRVKCRLVSARDAAVVDPGLHSGCPAVMAAPTAAAKGEGASGDEGQSSLCWPLGREQFVARLRSAGAGPQSLSMVGIGPDGEDRPDSIATRVLMDEMRFSVFLPADGSRAGRPMHWEIDLALATDRRYDVRFTWRVGSESLRFKPLGGDAEGVWVGGARVVSSEGGGVEIRVPITVVEVLARASRVAAGGASTWHRRIRVALRARDVETGSTVTRGYGKLGNPMRLEEGIRGLDHCAELDFVLDGKWWVSQGAFDARSHAGHWMTDFGMLDAAHFARPSVGEASEYARGAAVYSPINGVVVRSEMEHPSMGIPGQDEFASELMWRDSAGVSIEVVHVLPASRRLRAGDTVKRGEVVARVGSVGTGLAHLHLSASRGADADTVPIALQDVVVGFNQPHNDPWATRLPLWVPQAGLFVERAVAR